jgi:uracil phosphoribosyltransferase
MTSSDEAIPENVWISQNPFVQHALALLRDKDCPGATFRDLLNQISVFLTFEAMSELPVGMKSYHSKTPTGFEYEGRAINSREFALIALMRSGQTMASAVHPYLPSSFIGHAGFRLAKGSDQMTAFYLAMPDLADKFCLVFDSGAISGRSVVSTIEYMITRKNADPDRIAIITAITTKPAIELLNQKFPGENVKVYAAACDTKIHNDGRITYSEPGAGSFQERMFGSVTPYEEKYETWGGEL